MPIARCTFEWLTASHAATTTCYEGEEDVPRTTIPMPEGSGDSWFTSLRLPLNTVVRRGAHHFKPEMMGRLFQLWRWQEKYTEPILCIQSARTGRVVLSDNRIGSTFIFGPDGCLFQHLDSLDNTPALDASEDIEVTNLLISDATLGELLGPEEAQRLLQRLRVATVPSAAVNKVPRHIAAILYASMDGHLVGNVRKLYAQAKVLEYICALSIHVAASSTEPHSGSKNEMAMHQLQKELMQLEGKVPTLDELSERYGMSAKVLNEEFKRLFGSSVFVFVTELRLKEAHETLLKTTVPMKTLAANLGYSHVNHFINAFGKKYGYPPGSLRRNLKTVG